jgi:hypothetical protein
MCMCMCIFTVDIFDMYEQRTNSVRTHSDINTVQVRFPWYLLVDVLCHCVIFNRTSF